jgi:hypothetical protein
MAELHTDFLQQKMIMSLLRGHSDAQYTEEAKGDSARLSVRYLIASGMKKKPAAKPRKKRSETSSFFSSARCVIIGPPVSSCGVYFVLE